jgi:phosphoglycerol transferase MdoB-like AlkP superfamily enzyme
MISSNASTAGVIASAFGVMAGYFICLWRVFRSNPANRLVECGTITVSVFYSMVPFSLIPGIRDHFPDWILMPYLLLVFLLCLTTLFFLAQRIWRALFRRAKRSS